jgi:predicted small metal-binding protein
MARKVIDCREYPSVKNCTIAMAADTTDELLELAVLHAASAHDHADTPELRDQLRVAIKESALT